MYPVRRGWIVLSVVGSGPLVLLWMVLWVPVAVSGGISGNPSCLEILWSDFPHVGLQCLENLWFFASFLIIPLSLGISSYLGESIRLIVWAPPKSLDKVNETKTTLRMTSRSRSLRQKMRENSKMVSLFPPPKCLETLELSFSFVPPPPCGQGQRDRQLS